MARKVRLIFLLCGLVFFCYLVFDFGITKIWDNIEKMGWWLLPVIGTWGLVYLLNALSWKVIIGKEGQQISFNEIFRITLSSFAINYTTPVMNLGGEPFRVLAVQERLGVRKAVSSVILFRMLHSFAHVVFWLVAVVMVAATFSISGDQWIYLILVSALLLALTIILLLMHRKGILHLSLRFFMKTPLLSTFAEKLKLREEAILEIDERIKELYHDRRNEFYIALALETASRFVSSLEFYFILMAVGSPITLLGAFYINAASSLILNVFFFVPFELGAREGSLYLILEGLHYTSGMGVFVSLVNRIRELFWILVGLGLIHFQGKPTGQVETTELLS